MKLTVKKTKYSRIHKLIYSKFIDNRGKFSRIYCEKTLKKIKFKIKQINISKNTKKGTFRGFHFQSICGESKIFNVLKGEVYFFSLNIKKEDKDYLKHARYKISEKSGFAIHVPKHYATAFLTLKPNTEILYLMNNYYNSKYSKGINFNDPKIKIRLPFKPKIISKKDKNWSFI
jgi:dTDP-4-dehydrorhamnose 3,5-epimerase